MVKIISLLHTLLLLYSAKWKLPNSDDKLKFYKALKHVGPLKIEFLKSKAIQYARIYKN